MGDVIHALPGVASLKHSFPRSHVSWVIRPRWMPLLEGNPFVDEIIPLERSLRGIRAARGANCGRGASIWPSTFRAWCNPRW